MQMLGRTTMNTEVDILDLSSEESIEALTNEVPLLAFRVVGCTVVTSLVGLTIIIYITSGMFHIDCLAQICSETCIFAAYMLILLTTTEPFRINKGMCLAISIFLHFLFVSAQFFLLLEVLCMCQALVPFFYRNMQLTTASVLTTGWLFPAAITGISAIIWFNKYTTKSNCWLNYSESPFYPSIIPIMSCTGLLLLLILITLLVSEAPRLFPTDQYKRAKCYRTTRLASSIIAVMVCLSWWFGVRAYHTGREDMYAAFTVASILMGVCVLILRISTDDEIREKITRNIMWLIVPSNQVTAISTKSMQFTENTTDSLLNSMKNGKVPFGENGKVLFGENAKISFGDNGKAMFGQSDTVTYGNGNVTSSHK